MIIIIILILIILILIIIILIIILIIFFSGNGRNSSLHESFLRPLEPGVFAHSRTGGTSELRACCQSRQNEEVRLKEGLVPVVGIVSSRKKAREAAKTPLNKLWPPTLMCMCIYIYIYIYYVCSSIFIVVAPNAVSCNFPFKHRQ